MTCNRCLQEIIEGESFWEDEAEGTAYHNDCRRAAIDRRNKAEDERAAALARAEAAEAEALKQARRAEEAEAERDDLRERHDNLKTAYANLVQEAADRLTRMYSAEAEAAGLRARAEAAEAERDDANIAASLNKSRVEEMVDRLSFEMKRREALAARVAELDAQLAAQGWRAMNTPPEAPGEYEIGADYIPDVRRAEYHVDTNTWYEQIWQLADWATRWRPLPAPAPDMEPTP